MAKRWWYGKARFYQTPGFWNFVYLVFTYQIKLRNVKRVVFSDRVSVVKIFLTSFQSTYFNSRLKNIIKKCFLIIIHRYVIFHRKWSVINLYTFRIPVKSLWMILNALIFLKWILLDNFIFLCSFFLSSSIASFYDSLQILYWLLI